ncbi:acetyl-CoA carboxylase biotin carboxyl carrier protein [soil metagenome]
MSEDTAPAKGKEGERTETGPSESAASLNLAELRELAELVNEYGFTDFKFENENIKVRLSKQAAAPIFQAYQPAPSTLSDAAPAAAPAASAEIAPTDPDEGLHKITSPIVGTFYRSPGPDKDPYVSEGAKVTSDSVVCIVEAMKLMNEIQAEASGEIVKIYVEDGQPVEYGQPLFGIKR